MGKCITETFQDAETYSLTLPHTSQYLTFQGGGATAVKYHRNHAEIH